MPGYTARHCIDNSDDVVRYYRFLPDNQPNVSLHVGLHVHGSICTRMRRRTALHGTATKSTASGVKQLTYTLTLVVNVDQ